MRDIVIIVAQDRAGGIGKENSIPWRLPEDLRHFRETTSGNAVIMGRKTWESIGSVPLKNRINAIVSRTLETATDAFLARSLDDAIMFVEPLAESVFVIGGAEIYKEAMPIANRLIVSHVDIETDADRYFPDIDPDIWEMISETSYPDARIPFKVSEYVRLKD